MDPGSVIQERDTSRAQSRIPRAPLIVRSSYGTRDLVAIRRGLVKRLGENTRTPRAYTTDESYGGPVGGISRFPEPCSAG